MSRKIRVAGTCTEVKGGCERGKRPITARMEADAIAVANRKSRQSEYDVQQELESIPTEWTAATTLKTDC